LDGAADDLEQLLRRADPDRWLTSRFIGDAGARADVVALYLFDHELARARRAASSSLLAEIRLTWWREALDEIYDDGPVRRHPVAEALAAAVARRGVPRAPLEAMIDGHIVALDAGLMDSGLMDAGAALAWADAVQGSLAEAAAMTLDPAGPVVAARPAGRAWGLALLKRAGLASAEAVAAPLEAALAETRRTARALSAAALPAALPARLARFDLAERTPGPVAARLALIQAVVTGRI
jgi:phytoene synthase